MFYHLPKRTVMEYSIFFNWLRGTAFALSALRLRALSTIKRAEFDQTWAIMTAKSSFSPKSFKLCKR